MAVDPKAIEKAKSRIRVAEKAIADLESAQSHVEFSDTWYTFLVAAKNVYTTLQQGVKGNRQDMQWFGARQADRKADELLQYLFQARNDDEHSLEETTRFEPGVVTFTTENRATPTSLSANSIIIKNGKLVVDGMRTGDGRSVVIERKPPHTRLSPVTGPGPVVYQPPTSHLGKKLNSNLPVEVAKLGIAYLKALVSEAEARA